MPQKRAKPLMTGGAKSAALAFTREHTVSLADNGSVRLGDVDLEAFVLIEHD